jgi:hypothetical protein
MQCFLSMLVLQEWETSDLSATDMATLASRKISSMQMLNILTLLAWMWNQYAVHMKSQIHLLS